MHPVSQAIQFEVNLKLLRFVQRRKVTGPVIVAVSGGPDSVALLHSLVELALPEIVIHVAHYQHQLRGGESAADADFVRELCQQLNVTFHLKHASPGELKPGQSHLECKARELRYQWLTELAESLKSNWVMTGHTMNDQAETVLHHLMRGTGWRGLRGIAPCRSLTASRTASNTKVMLLRPFLSCSRAEINDFLTIRALPARHDTSNDDLQFKRNQIRHVMLPSLIGMKHDVVRHLSNWARVARREYRLILQQAKRLASSAVVHSTENKLAMRQQSIRGLHDDVLQELLRLCWRRQGWPVDQMSRLRWQEVKEVCQGVRKAVEVQGRIRVIAIHGVVQMTRT